MSETPDNNLIRHQQNFTRWFEQAKKEDARYQAKQQMPLVLEQVLGEERMSVLIQQAAELGFVNPRETVEQAVKDSALRLMQSSAFQDRISKTVLQKLQEEASRPPGRMP